MTRPAVIPEPRTAASPAGSPVDAHPVLAMLAAGIPLTLLLDLVDPHGPDSRAIIADERRQARRAASA